MSWHEQDVKPVITDSDIRAAIATLELDCKHPVAMKMSSDVKSQFHRAFGAPVPPDFAKVIIYGLPVTIVPGENICRIVYSDGSEEEGR